MRDIRTHYLVGREIRPFDLWVRAAQCLLSLANRPQFDKPARMTTSKFQPYKTIIAAHRNNLLFFGDHASKHIPDEFDNLGLQDEDLTRHIAWDIGTETIIRELCAYFGCAGHIAGVSRLVIDFNRDSASVSAIPAVTDTTTVPGNQNVSQAEKSRRIELFHEPYHQALGKVIESLDSPFVISVHSFTPKPYNGPYRPTEIGLLVKDDEKSADQLVQSFSRMNKRKDERNFAVGINEPYSAYDLNYTVDRHVGPRGLRHLAIEIRQDHIDSEEKAKDIAAVLANRLEPVLNPPE